MKTTSLLTILALAACTEYTIKPGGDVTGGEDTEHIDTAPRDTGKVDVDACAEFEDIAAEDVELNAECDVDLSTGSFTPVIEWTYGSSSFCGPPAVGQIIDTNSSGAIDSDDMPIVLLYQSNRVVALYGDTGRVAWTSAGSYGQDGGFAVGDLDGDGWPEVVTANSTMVCALDGADGAEVWCKTGLSSSLDPYGYSYPSIADMDGDGKAEVTVGRTILSGTGVVLGTGSYGIGAAPYSGTGTSGSYGAMSVPIDLDGDGTLELVTGNAAYSLTGGTVWYNGGKDGLVAVADFDGDGKGEIVKTSGIYVTGMEADGTEVWGPLTYSGNLGAPAVDDLDGDGTPEFVFAAQNKLIAMEWGGTTLWTATISDSSGAAGPTLFDFELDGYPEVLYADETSIRFFSGLDGSVKYSSTAHGSYTILETPVIADVDGDDQVEIILGHCSATGSIGAISVYGDADGSWPPGRKIWNQHAYYITNIEELGGVPAPTANNWPDYNSFRSGDVGRPPGEYWDLRAEVLDVCEDECDTGKVYIAARVLNAGNVDAPAGIPVSLRAGAGGIVLAVQPTTEVLFAGKSGEALYFEVEASAIAGKIPAVTADEDETGSGILYECEEDNNIEVWTSAVCGE